MAGNLACVSICLLLIASACNLHNGQTIPYIDPVNIEGVVGQNVNITCVVGTSEPELTNLVTTGSQQLEATEVVLSDRVVFTYGPLTSADDGVSVMCSYGQAPFPTGNIAVFFAAEYTLDPLTVEVIEGATPLAITVTVNANPVPTDEETTWTMVGGAIGPDVQVTYNTITFTNIVRSIAGVYVVTSTTSAGTSTPLEITVNVLYPPVFQAVSGTCNIGSMPIVCAVQEGSMGSFNCDTLGFPSPTVTITGVQAESGYTVADNVVELNSATSAANDALISCMAVNDQGTTNREYRVYVGTVPGEPTNVMATIDSDTVTVTWMFDNSGNNVTLTKFTYDVRQNGAVVDEDTIGPGERSVTISLSNLTAGTLYDVSITAHNLLGMSQVVGNQFTTPAKPVILDSDTSDNTFVGDELFVQCQVGGVPDPTVTWSKDGADLVDNSPSLRIITVGNISRVEVDSARQTNAGMYTCTATNVAGSASMVLNVNVLKTVPLQIEQIIGLAVGIPTMVFIVILVILLLLVVCLCARLSKKGAVNEQHYAETRLSSNPAYDLPDRQAIDSGSDNGSTHLYDVIDTSPDVVKEMDTNPSYVRVS